MPKKIIERRTIPLPPLPQGNRSSLGVTDIIYDDGSMDRLWEKDDGVQILGITPKNEVIAITERGYTHLVGGYIDPRESAEAAARRELLEETGYEAGETESLGALLQDSGGSERAIWFYLATGCRKVRDGEADIKVTLMSPCEFWQLISAIQADDTKRKGLMSLAVAALAFTKLGWLTVTHNI